MDPLRRLWSYGLSLIRDPRTYRFVAVGVATLILAEALMFGMVDLLGAESFLSAVIVTELVLVTNFFINDRWTFKTYNDPSNRFSARLLKFHVSRLGSIAVNLATFYTLNKVFLVHYLVAYFLAVVVAFTFNLITSFVWVWRVSPTNYERIGKGSVGGQSAESSLMTDMSAHLDQSSHSSTRCQNQWSSSSTST
ncbi:MAG: GtrA family protein [Thaumarchaeota archaeon]|nr:GtrA family protein [Candidatus Calditenuaceae archaeon]MDW8187387.1 GtrA family protein [Nitrososphaerota archaeon]